MRMYVDAEALNLRSEPEISPETRLGILHLCQPIDVLGQTEVSGWVRVSAELDGRRQEGVVSRQFLRAPTADAREALIAQTIGEWLRFEKGLGREFDDPFAGFVGEMWQAIGMSLDGRDRDVPWSAAAISFMVRNAGRTFPQYQNFRSPPPTPAISTMRSSDGGGTTPGHRSGDFACMNAGRSSATWSAAGARPSAISTMPP